MTGTENLERFDNLGMNPGDSDRLCGLIVEHAPACIALLRGPDFIFEAVNPACAAIAPGIAMLGRRIADVFPDAAAFAAPRLRHVLETGQPFRAEDQPFTISRNIGSPPEVAYFSFSYTRIRDGETADRHSILVMAQETTAGNKAGEERESAIAELQLQRRIFDTALSNTPDATYVFDCRGRFIYANRALLARLKRSLADVTGKNFFELGYPQELATRVHRQIDELVHSGLPVHGETELPQQGGSARHYEYIFVPVFADSGEVEAVAGSTRDITERKQAEQKERDRQEQVRESARLESLGVMAGGIAHDFNNLLTGILGNASLLAENAKVEDRPLARQIVFAAERAAELTQQMLAFTGKGSFVIEIVDLKTLVRENLTLLRASLSRSVTVELELDGEACLVEADRAQIQQIVMNLLINASEAVGDRPGKVTIRTAPTVRTEPRFSAHMQAAIQPGRYVLLEVRDDGSGMTPATLKRVFDPFFTTKFTGRGLGLAAVLGIVKGHRGDIEVESQPGQGTTFRVFLPKSDRAVSLPAQPQEVAQVHVPGKTVLVVDDEEIVRKTATQALQRQGFHVLAAVNGAEALEILRTDSAIALVILDLTMPVMTGEQAIPLIKIMRPDLPIILSSGFGEAEISRRFASSGVAGFLQKPYTVAAIRLKAMQALQEV
jgi:two-component system, cell cycle sensor histidine kinase and response regulator CckA